MALGRSNRHWLIVFLLLVAAGAGLHLEMGRIYASFGGTPRASFFGPLREQVLIDRFHRHRAVLDRLDEIDRLTLANGGYRWNFAGWPDSTLAALRAERKGAANDLMLWYGGSSESLGGGRFFTAGRPVRRGELAEKRGYLHCPGACRFEVVAKIDTVRIRPRAVERAVMYCRPLADDWHLCRYVWRPPDWD